MNLSFFKPHAAKPIVFYASRKREKHGIVNIIYLSSHSVAIFIVVSCSNIWLMWQALSVHRKCEASHWRCSRSSCGRQLCQMAAAALAVPKFWAHLPVSNRHIRPSFSPTVCLYQRRYSQRIDIRKIWYWSSNKDIKRRYTTFIVANPKQLHISAA
jgi:hypothetical protein